MNRLFISLLGLAALLVSLSFHEYCHALAGYLLGDQTAKRLGRLTLNPLAHLDPIGTVLVPLIGAMTGLPLIGWAKPVPFNPYNLKYPRWGPTMVALSGPGANFLAAAVCLVGLKIALEAVRLPFSNLLVIFLFLLIIVNVFLGLFNFIPLPPLDGSKLLGALLPHPKYQRPLLVLETRGPIILFALIILDSLAPFSFISGMFNFVLGGVFSLAGMRYALGLFGFF